MISSIKNNVYNVIDYPRESLVNSALAEALFFQYWKIVYLLTLFFFYYPGSVDKITTLLSLSPGVVSISKHE